MTTEFESPFDSNYHPASKSDSLDPDKEWFSLESSSNGSASDDTAEQWGFALLSIADGAAGAFLSIDVKTSTTLSTELYARHEGCPSSSIWDLKATKEDHQRISELGGESQGLRQGMDGPQALMASKYQTLSLPVVYPMEGFWCIGWKYTFGATGMRVTVLDNSSSSGNRMVGDALDILHGNLSSGSGSGNRNEMELRVVLHGCPNKCSGHGSCQTVTDASRLHFIRCVPVGTNE